MTPRQAKFVAEYLKHGNATQAAINVGYSSKYAKNRAYDLMHRSPMVMEALAEAQKAVGTLAIYNGDKAMKELDDAMAFARETKNATALARCIELKAKLTGLMTEDREGKGQANFQINILGVDNPAPAEQLVEVIDFE